jgi:DNA polymerase III subunit alpha
MTYTNRPIVGPHNHVTSSLDSGNSTPTFLKAAAKDFGRTAIAITDHGMIGSLIEAHQVSKDLKKDGIDIKVIPGVELYIVPDLWDDSGFTYYHLTVHFQDFSTYLDACKLSKSAFDRSVFKGGELKPLTTWDELRSLSGKVTILSGCLVGCCQRPLLTGRKDIAEKYFKNLIDIAGPGRFFAEVFPYEVGTEWNSKTKTFDPINVKSMKDPKVRKGRLDLEECFPSGKLQVDANKWILHLADKYSIPVVISEDAHYAHAKDKLLQDLRLNQGSNENWKMSDSNCLHTNDWLYSELNRIHPEVVTPKVFDGWVDNSYQMLDNFKGFEPKFKPSLPKFDIGHECGSNCSTHKTPEDALVEYVIKKIISNNRFDMKDPIYSDRIKSEMQQLAYNGKINLLPYFLTLTEIIDWCGNNDVLVGPGRGSAAGCLISYGLKITSIDPIKEDLSFERFFDVSRVEDGLADIDTDFSDRVKVIEFVKQRFGDNFAFLGTGTTFKTKSALKDLDRLINGEVRKTTLDVCKTITNSPQGVEEEKFLKGYTDTDGTHQPGELERNEDLVKYLSENPIAAEYLFKLTGLTRQMSRHAAGVIIAGEPVQNFIPVTKISDETTTQLMPKWVEKSGGVKYDLLGINTLEDIRLCLKLIEQRTGAKIDPWNVPDTKKHWADFVNDPTTVFQFHTNTVRPGLIKMQPSNVQHAAILTSLFRPGALDAPSDQDPSKTMADIFLECWQGYRKPHYIHSDLEPILKDTMGVIVYQESIMRIAHELAGLSMVETQKLRKMISKKNSDELILILQKMGKNLIGSGWTQEQVDSLTLQIKASGRYSFCKAHGMSYAYLARACIYLKSEYPTEWWTSVLTNASKEDLRKYWTSVSRWVVHPKINHSTNQYKILDIPVDTGTASMILAPLTIIDGVGTAALTEIMAKRPFTSLEDMLQKVERRIINKRVMIKLIFSGAIDTFFDPGSTYLSKLQSYMDTKAKVEGKRTAESVPDIYRNLTPLKEGLIRKATYKVTSANFLEAAGSKLEKEGKLLKTPYFYKYIGKVGYVVNPSILDAFGISRTLESEDEAVFGMIGFVSEIKERLFQNNTKTMLNMTFEVEDLFIDIVKFPEWGESAHGVNPDIEESVCLIIAKKKSGDNRLTALKILQIEKFEE